MRRSPLALLLVATIAALYVALFVAALLGVPALFLALLLASQVVDEFVNRRSRGGRDLLRRMQFGQSNRALLREVLLLLLLGMHDDLSTATFLLTGAAVIAMLVARGLLVAMVPLLRSRSTLPVETRNVPLGTPQIAALALDIVGDVPPEEDTDDGPATPGSRGFFARWRTDTASSTFSLSGLVLVAGTVAVLLGTPLALAPLGLAAAVGMLLRVVHVGRLLRHRSDPELRQRYLALVNEQVQSLAPEVICYFSGTGKDSAYQVNMWLPVLEKTDRRALVMLRERVHMGTLGPTTVPVVCLPDPMSVMSFTMPTARIALYVANVGKNIHLLREPRLKHVFIGHGDSDKVASVNPFSKVHDEIWVAGRAARDRYAIARVGVRDDSIVEVGRPQLDSIATARPLPSDRPLTVLYAPTWEGWTSDTAQTSLVVQGVALVRALLDPALNVRLVFKPHPLTGTVTQEAAAALRRVTQLLRDAGATESSAMPGPEPTSDPAVAAERAERWSEAFWAGLPADRHLVVTSSAPTLFDCFNNADVLVGDISSVVSDFVASEKPYVVTNPDALPEDEFRAANPSTAGGYLLTPGGTSVEEIVRLVRTEDPMGASRRSAREHLLGPSDPPSIVRWNAAVEGLWARAEADWGPVGAGDAADGAPAGAQDDAQDDGRAVPEPRADAPDGEAADAADQAEGTRNGAVRLPS